MVYTFLNPMDHIIIHGADLSNDKYETNNFPIQLDLVLKDENGGDLSDFITNGEWYLIGEFILMCMLSSTCRINDLNHPMLNYWIAATFMLLGFANVVRRFVEKISAMLSASLYQDAPDVSE